MLPRTNRVPSSEQRSVMRSSRRIPGPYFQLLFVPNSTKLVRFAVVVPLKVDKRATGRNRIKRILSESVRTILKDLRPGWDCVVLVRQNISGMTTPDIQPILLSSLKKAGISG